MATRKKTSDSSQWYQKSSSRIEIGAIITISLFVISTVGKFYHTTVMEKIAASAEKATKVEISAAKSYTDIQGEINGTNLKLVGYEHDIKSTKEKLSDIEKGQEQIGDKLDQLLQQPRQQQQMYPVYPNYPNYPPPTHPPGQP